MKKRRGHEEDEEGREREREEDEGSNARLNPIEKIPQVPGVVSSRSSSRQLAPHLEVGKSKG